MKTAFTVTFEVEGVTFALSLGALDEMPKRFQLTVASKAFGSVLTEYFDDPESLWAVAKAFSKAALIAEEAML